MFFSQKEYFSAEILFCEKNRFLQKKIYFSQKIIAKKLRRKLKNDVFHAEEMTENRAQSAREKLFLWCVHGKSGKLPKSVTSTNKDPKFSRRIPNFLFPPLEEGPLAPAREVPPAQTPLPLSNSIALSRLLFCNFVACYILYKYFTSHALPALFSILMRILYLLQFPPKNLPIRCVLPVLLRSSYYSFSFFISL